MGAVRAVARVASVVSVAVGWSFGCAPAQVSAPAAWAALVEAHLCSAQTGSLLVEWGAGAELLRAPPGADVRERFRIPTTIGGDWVLFDVPSTGIPILTRVSHDGVERVAFGSDCARPTPEPAQGLQPWPVDSPSFTDEDLRVALARSRQGAPPTRATVVYLWSPHLSLSVDGYREIADACQDLGLVLEPVLFPGVDRELAKREAMRAGIPVAGLRETAALELLFRDALVHAPTIVVFAGTRVPTVLPGYRDAAGYGRFLEDFLGG